MLCGLRRFAVAVPDPGAPMQRPVASRWRLRINVVTGMMLVASLLPGSAPAGQIRKVWYVCEGVAPANDGCAVRTRLRGFRWIDLRVSCAPAGPWSAAPWAGFYGTLHISVEGRRAGHDRMTARCFNGQVTLRFSEDHSWSRFERITMTVTTSGLEDAVPALGPWEVTLGVPIETP